MMRGKQAAGLVAAALLVGSGAAQAALSPAVDGMVYDDVLNLCWLQNASASGELTWDAARAWADGLTVGGHTDWRLAQMSDTSQTTSITVCTSSNEEACRTSGNELGYNLWHNLGGPLSTTGSQGPFTNIPGLIWSATAFDTTNAYFLRASLDGGQVASTKANTYYGWAVREGQCRDAPPPPAGVQSVPAVGVLGLGLLGLLLAGVARARLR
jgi:hypothetical protein